ncbi:MAG: type II toxin-antitoxin system death-on-curing family toxin [Herpetosiphon sp.]
MTRYLSPFKLRTIRRDLERATGEQWNLLSQDALLSALAAPRQTMFNQELHPGLLNKAATLFFLLIKNHPFYDGNKRIAAEALRRFLGANGISLDASTGELVHMARAVATNAADTDAIYDWLTQVTVQQN